MYSNNKDFHLLTKKRFNKNPLLSKPLGLFEKLKLAKKAFSGYEDEYVRKSLIGADYEHILKGLRVKNKSKLAMCICLLIPLVPNLFL